MSLVLVIIDMVMAYIVRVVAAFRRPGLRDTTTSARCDGNEFIRRKEDTKRREKSLCRTKWPNIGGGNGSELTDFVKVGVCCRHLVPGNAQDMVRVEREMKEAQKERNGRGGGGGGVSRRERERPEVDRIGRMSDLP